MTARTIDRFRQEGVEPLTEKQRAKVVEILCSVGLADHLGDVPVDELFALIGLPEPDNDEDSLYSEIRAHLRVNGIALPAYLHDDDDDDD